MATRANRFGETGPFGPPDGARADVHYLERNFVDFANQPLLDDLASPPGDRSARLIVGKKGVGKTVYLRRFQRNAEQENSVYAVDIHHDVPATEDVIRVCELYPVELAAEGWQWIWRRAIMRALVSHVTCAPELRNRVDAAMLRLLEEEYAGVLGRFRRPHGIYAEARAIAVSASSRDRLARELRHRDWDDVEDVLGELLTELPPMCFYLDSVDEQFASAPLYWLQCQKGLCQQVLELHRDERFGNRLHIVVTVRDLVRSSLMQGEHSTRYLRARHIRVLDWDHEAIQYFLHAKVAQLPVGLQMAPGKTGVERWLGRVDIYNRARGVTENLEDYLLRHTRQIPRDVVQLGNELSGEVAQAKTRGDTVLDGDAIRRAVAKVSKEFADEQIAVCGNHLASDTMPSVAGRQNFSGFYTSAEYSQGVQDEVRRFIAAVGTDRFPMSTLHEALEVAGGEILAGHPHPLNVLWLNGMLGYELEDDARALSHFYGGQDVADFQLPDDFETYVFHPILAHSIRIETAGDRPVQPFL